MVKAMKVGLQNDGINFPSMFNALMFGVRKVLVSLEIQLFWMVKTGDSKQGKVSKWVSEVGCFQIGASECSDLVCNASSVVGGK